MSVFHTQPPFQNVGAGNTAVIPRLDMGDSVECLLLKLGGTFTKAQINAIRVKLAGKTVVDCTGSQMDTINKYMKRTANASYLPIWFADPNARSPLGREIGSIDTSVRYSGFSIECDINAAAVSPTLEAFMLKGAPKRENADHKLLFRAFISSTANYGAAGTFNLDVPLGSDLGNLIARVHLFHTNVTHFGVKKSGLELQALSAVGVSQYLQNEIRRTTQSGHYVYDPLFEDNQSEAVSTVKPNRQRATMEFQATTSAADTVISVAELYTAIQRL